MPRCVSIMGTSHEHGAVNTCNSVLYDIENDISMDATIEWLSRDERSL